MHLGDGEVIVPEVLLVGRNPDKLDAISKASGGVEMVDGSESGACRFPIIRFTSTRRPPIAVPPR